MQSPEALKAEAKRKALVRHLVLTFPHAAIMSRSVLERYHVFVIVPYDGSPEKTVQVEGAVYRESASSVKDFKQFLFQLKLPLLFQTRERYDLRSANPPAPGDTGGYLATDNRAISSRSCTSPAHEGWLTAGIRGTVVHGPVPLSDPFSPAPFNALCSVSSN